jgi:Fe2+ transport system protein B
MKQRGNLFSLLAVAFVFTLLVATVPASAEHGRGGDRTLTATTTSDDTTVATTDSTSSNETEQEVENPTDQTHQSGSLRAQAQKLLQTKRQEVHEHTAAERQKACEARQKSIDRRTSNYGTAAQRHLDVFNSIFTKVQQFHDSKQLNVSNYDALVAAATAKQTAAQSAVTALKALNVQIDCTQSDPAATVATIKSAVADARTSLQAYRSALKDLVVALKGASSAQHTDTNNTDNTTTGGAQ